jgi:hypothetical protein
VDVFFSSLQFAFAKREYLRINGPTDKRIPVPHWHILVSMMGGIDADKNAEWTSHDGKIPKRFLTMMKRKQSKSAQTKLNQLKSKTETGDGQVASSSGGTGTSKQDKRNSGACPNYRDEESDSESEHFTKAPSKRKATPPKGDNKRSRPGEADGSELGENSSEKGGGGKSSVKTVKPVPTKGALKSGYKSGAVGNRCETPVIQDLASDPGSSGSKTAQFKNSESNSCTKTVVIAVSKLGNSSKYKIVDNNSTVRDTKTDTDEKQERERETGNKLGENKESMAEDKPKRQDEKRMEKRKDDEQMENRKADKQRETRGHDKQTEKKEKPAERDNKQTEKKEKPAERDNKQTEKKEKPAERDNKKKLDSDSDVVELSDAEDGEDGKKRCTITVLVNKDDFEASRKNDGKKRVRRPPSPEPVNPKKTYVINVEKGDGEVVPVNVTIYDQTAKQKLPEKKEKSRLDKDETNRVEVFRKAVTTLQESRGKDVTALEKSNEEHTKILNSMKECDTQLSKIQGKVKENIAAFERLIEANGAQKLQKENQIDALAELSKKSKATELKPTFQRHQSIWCDRESESHIDEIDEAFQDGYQQAKEKFCGEESSYRKGYERGLAVAKGRKSIPETPEKSKKEQVETETTVQSEVRRQLGEYFRNYPAPLSFTNQQTVPPSFNTQQPFPLLPYGTVCHSSQVQFPNRQPSQADFQYGQASDTQYVIVDTGHAPPQSTHLPYGNHPSCSDIHSSQQSQYLEQHQHQQQPQHPGHHNMSMDNRWAANRVVYNDTMSPAASDQSDSNSYIPIGSNSSGFISPTDDVGQSRNVVSAQQLCPSINRNEIVDSRVNNPEKGDGFGQSKTVVNRSGASAAVGADDTVQIEGGGGNFSPVAVENRCERSTGANILVDESEIPNVPAERLNHPEVDQTLPDLSQVKQPFNS